MNPSKIDTSKVVLDGKLDPKNTVVSSSLLLSSETTTSVTSNEPKLVEAPALGPDDIMEQPVNVLNTMPSIPAQRAAKGNNSNVPLVTIYIVVACFLILASLAYLAYSKHM
jgi:hypothetical protein